MKVIALDSSGLVASVAVIEDDILIAEYSVQYRKTHSQTLLPMLDEIRRITDLSLDSVDAIAVACGPGSFTGLRIGSATAKGLGFALDIPLVEIPTLEGLAFNLHGTDRLVCPMLDARRNQVYTGVYQFAGHELTTLIAPCAVPLTEIAATLNNYEHSVILLGDGASVYAKELESLLKIPYSLAPPHQNRQRAASLAALAQQYIKRGKTTTAAAHAPDYLRVSQAERVKAERERGGTHATIRPMTAADVEVVSEIESRVFSMPWRAADFLEMITAEYAYYYVALINNKPIGAAGARVIAGDAQITNILVDHPYRRCGIARALMQHMLTDLTEKADIFSLEVRTSNIAAINLYQSLGFTPTGHRRDFYENPVEDALVMVKGVSCNIGSKCLRSKGVQC